MTLNPTTMKPTFTFEYNELKVELFDNGTKHWDSKTYLNSKLVYSDSTYRPSPLYARDSVDIMVVLISFLVLQEGDVESSYFEERNTPELTNWANTSLMAEAIRTMVNDYEMKDEEGYLEESDIELEDLTTILIYIN